MQTHNDSAIYKAGFRYYEELNDFLPSSKRKVSIHYYFHGKPSVKDAIEAMGIPHVEVDLILVNGQPVDFSYSLQDQDRVSVYPVFESLDISSINRLRGKPLRNPKFILDVHLGKLARYLRMMGFDSLYRNDYKDDHIIEISLRDKRIILTRDKGILMNERVTHGYWLRSIYIREQVAEVLRRFDLFSQLNPFTRCTECNAEVAKVAKKEILDVLKPGTRKDYNEFFRCTGCGKVYWEGTHHKRMQKFIESLRIS
jgi:uncharacterized protein with PIN domain